MSLKNKFAGRRAAKAECRSWSPDQLTNANCRYSKRDTIFLMNYIAQKFSYINNNYRDSFVLNFCLTYPSLKK
jgi:hypothetical protein